MFELSKLIKLMGLGFRFQSQHSAAITITK